MTDIVTCCKQVILTNLAAGRHHYHRINTDLMYSAMSARMQLTRAGLIERDDEPCCFRFRLTEKGRAECGRLALEAAQKEAQLCR